VATACVAIPIAARAQDTTQANPWRMSDFPYVTASPNDGVMGVARAVWFRQSRYDSRVSVADQVAVDAGYSTRDAWLARARGDFPRLAPGWRLQVIVDALSTPELEVIDGSGVEAARQSATAEVTREISGPLLLAVRGAVAHIGARFYDIGGAVDDSRPRNYETDWHVRLAAIFDRRDREYDTRRGVLLQTGVLAGHFRDSYRSALLDDASYTGWYGTAAGWLPIGAATRITTRVGARALSAGADNGLEAERVIPEWEDDVAALGGPESNRGLPIGAVQGRGVLLAGAEIRRDVVSFPGGAIALLAFVDGGRTFADNSCDREQGLSPDPGCGESGALRITLSGWTVAPGAGVALRLLRNAVLVASVARAEHATRIYVSSGWSW
jgi:hypothetical protein